MDMRALSPEKGIRLFDIKWLAETAGPSPNGTRIEVFLLGCDKAMKGNPCKGCFNSITWNANKAEWSWDPIELADMINEGCDPNHKYITIGGGEPTDQVKNLVPFTKRLKEHGFHIIMYTWRDLEQELKTENIFNPQKELCMNLFNLLKYVDIIIDGEFKQDECLYQQELGDGMLNSIGSANQKIWDIKHWREHLTALSYPLKDLVGLYIKPDTNDLVYITKEKKECSK